MKKLLIYLFSIFFVSLLASTVLAVSSQGQGNSNGSTNPQGSGQQGNQVVDPIQNQNQVQTQNMGENQQLQVQTQQQQQEGAGTGNQSGQNSQAKKYGVNQSMGQVAQQIQKLMQIRSGTGGIGDQVKQWAQNQNQSQQKLQKYLAQIEERQGLVRSLLGPRYGALNEVKKEMQQNNVRVQQLEKLKLQLNNEGDITNIQEMITLMQQQNTSLQEKVSAEERNGGLFGWFFKLFAI